MRNNNQIIKPILIKDLGSIYPTITSTKKRRFGLYKCMCGNNFKARIENINSGHTSSCGCYQRCVTHGKTKHKLYSVWRNMMSRCNRKEDNGYINYGARGIIVCKRWHNLINFIEDMGDSFKEGLSIDREDNNGNYEPSNCRWTTKCIQSRNTRKIRKNNTSGYRGVSLNKKTEKYNSYIYLDGKKKTLGYFKTKIEAAKAYDKYVIDNNLEHTKNF